MLKLTAIAAAVSAAIAFGAAWSWQGSRCDAGAEAERADRLQAALDGTSEALRREIDKRRQSEQIAAEHLRERDRARQRAASLSADLTQLGDNADEQYQNCRAVPVPDSIRERLQRAQRHNRAAH